MFEIDLEFREWACKGCNCSIDKKDPCASCPEKKWPKFYLCEEGKENQKETIPSFVKMVKTFGVALKQESMAILKKQDPISNEEKQKRFETCQTCQFFIESSQKCMKCGCFMPIKTSWRSQHCPIGKW
jgi:hypothetical protein